jgi:hypothetical protein
MSGESLPSGVLKVAEECARLAEEFAEVCILARNVNAPIRIAARSGLHAAIDQLAALASPPPQATGALSEPLDEVVERAAFVADAKRRGWTPGEFMLGAYAGWLAAKSAASQVEPEEKHG